jgi:nicotinate-nucleotide adenylyltransferase
MTSIGILGGTFDPIHYGHLRMAQELAESLGLSSVRLIPSARPPHRDQPAGEAQHRLAMARLAVEDNSLLTVDAREFERSGPSYTFDTLTSLRAELGAATPLYLLLGADAFLGLTTWHRWRELFDLAHIAVAHRPGWVLEEQQIPPALRDEWRRRYVDTPSDSASGSLLLREITALDISASAIRKVFQQGGYPRYLLPDSVLGYILEHNLYYSGTA